MIKEKEIEEISCRKCGKIISKEIASHHNDEICQTCYLERNPRPKEYVCPHCKQTQTKIIVWTLASVGDRFDVSSGQFEKQIDVVMGETENYSCPSCNKNLSYQFVHNNKLII